jgi:hypothetical protein
VAIDGLWNASELSPSDHAKFEEGTSLLQSWWPTREDEAWKPVLKPDRLPLDLGVKGYGRYVRAGRSEHASEASTRAKRAHTWCWSASAGKVLQRE